MTVRDVPVLRLAQAFDQELRAHAERVYPNECCGVVYGRDSNGFRDVSSLEPVDNSFESGEQHHRFSITARALMNAERRAAREGTLVLGFYHSHPDHPSAPSEYDRQHAWPFYSYLIVSVEKGRAAELTSWQLNESTEQFDPGPIHIV